MQILANFISPNFHYFYFCFAKKQNQINNTRNSLNLQTIHRRFISVLQAIINAYKTLIRRLKDAYDGNESSNHNDNKVAG